MKKNIDKIKWLVFLIFGVILIWAGKNNLHLKHSEAFCLYLLLASFVVTIIILGLSKYSGNSTS